jgi:hypothetical protein
VSAFQTRFLPAQDPGFQEPHRYLPGFSYLPEKSFKTNAPIGPAIPEVIQQEFSIGLKGLRYL